MHDNDHRWERQWRRLEMMARRGFKGWSGFNFGPGDFGQWGGNFKVGRMLASGDLRLVALYLIEQQPRHGYDLIKAVEEKSEGFYSPSPGIVYPALTFLEEAGYVTSQLEGNKKLYAITDEGRAHLSENRAAIESVLNFLGSAGAQVRQWREKMGEGLRGNEPDGDDEGTWRPAPPPPPRPEGAPHFGGQHRGPHHERPGERPDRDMDGVEPELNEARKLLKRAIKDAARRGPAEQLRVAQILADAAAAIRAEDDIDL
jgi:DNA-binding PadR family transcriptional regulator